MYQVRTFARKKMKTALPFLFRALMHFSGQYRYCDEYVPQKQGTVILYVLQIVKTDQS